MTEPNEPTGPISTVTEGERLENARVFGQMMRASREVSGYSLDDLAQATRISQPFLKALEEGRFEVLPGDVFARGFIRSICKTVGEDSSDFLDAFAVASRPPAGQKTGLHVSAGYGTSSIELRSEQRNSFKDWTSGFKNKQFSLPEFPYRTIGILALVVLIIPFALWVIGAPKDSADSVPQGSTAENVGSGLPDKVERSEDLAAKVIGAEVNGEAANPVAAAEPNIKSESEKAVQKDDEQSEVAVFSAKKEDGLSGQVLDFTVDNTVEVRVSLDSGAWVRKQYEPGNYQIPFNETANVLVMDAAAIRIKFNGRKLGKLGSKGRVRRLSFKAGSGQLGKKQKGS